jgi:hypothetical protein
MQTKSEVKGIWFVTLQHFLTDALGAEGFARVVRAVPEPHRDALEAPLTSSWYPEEALQAALHAVHDAAAHGDRIRYTALVEGATQHAISRFFRALLRATTARFLLKQIPTMWRRIRLDATRFRVDVDAEGVTVRYDGFPYFDDPLYRWMAIGSVRGIARLATRDPVHVEEQDHGRDFLHLRVTIAGGADV